jgi:hypothetical protein
MTGKGSGKAIGWLTSSERCKAVHLLRKAEGRRKMIPVVRNGLGMHFNR